MKTYNLMQCGVLQLHLFIKYCKIGHIILTMKAEKPIKHKRQDILLCLTVCKLKKGHKNRLNCKF
jgi:hypothetical protein